jgi:hypothetical protein
MTNRNHPDRVEDALLRSARDILLSPNNTFVVKPWREIMKAKSRKPEAAEESTTPAVFKDPFHMFKRSVVEAEPAARVKRSKLVVQDDLPPVMGIDDDIAHMVQSSGDGAMNALTQSLTEPRKTKMSDMTPEEKLEVAASKKALAEKTAALKAAEKQAKIDAKALAKAERDDAKAVMRLKALAERDDAKAEKVAARIAAGGAASAQVGMADALRQRVIAGSYVKGTNGQMRTTDELALALEVVSVPNMVPLLKEVLGLAENPYSQLNQGQQSMNLRNRLRGAIRRNAQTPAGEAITIGRVIEVRDAHYTVVAAAVAAADTQDLFESESA